MKHCLLETRGLTKAFGGLRAVDRLDFRLEEGELRCLIGPNGAGKSTFFHLMTGRWKPTQGEIRFRGLTIGGMHPHQIARMGITMKYQVPSLFEALTVRENLRIPAQRGRRPADAGGMVESLLDETHLAERADEPATNLSHGEKQWLEIGMVLATSPTLVLLDEPTAGMSVEETRQTVELVNRLNQRATVIVVEHDMHFIRQIARKVTVLHQGSVFAEGSMEEIRSNHAVRDIYLGRESHA